MCRFTCCCGAVFVLVGLLLGAFYFDIIAQQVRDKRLRWGVLLRQVWGDWARLTALSVIAVGAILLLGLPILLLTGLLSLISPILGGLVWVGGLMVILWVLFYGGFALHGMLLQRRGLFPRPVGQRAFGPNQLALRRRAVRGGGGHQSGAGLGLEHPRR